MSQQCIQLSRDTWFDLGEKNLSLSSFMVANTHLSWRVICVADARTPGRQVKELHVPEVFLSCETVLASGRGQLSEAGAGAVAPVTINGPQVFLLFQRFFRREIFSANFLGKSCLWEQFVFVTGILEKKTCSP